MVIIMIVALVVIFFVIFFVLASIAKKNTGTTPSFDDLGKATLGVMLIIGFVVVFIILPILMMFI